MQDKYRLYRRSNGMFYAEECGTARRESLRTKDKAEALRLVSAKNQAASQPILNLEMAKVYLRAQDPDFMIRTWREVSNSIESNYLGATLRRWRKFARSIPLQSIIDHRPSAHPDRCDRFPDCFATSAGRCFH